VIEVGGGREREREREREGGRVGAEILRFRDGTHVSAHFNVKEDVRVCASTRFATTRTWASHAKYTVANVSHSCIAC